MRGLRRWKLLRHLFPFTATPALGIRGTDGATHPRGIDIDRHSIVGTVTFLKGVRPH